MRACANQRAVPTETASQGLRRHGAASAHARTGPAAAIRRRSLGGENSD
jgi:hypothetical protein